MEVGMSNDKPTPTTKATGSKEPAKRSSSKTQRKKAPPATPATPATDVVATEKNSAEPETAPERSSVVPAGTAAGTKFAAMLGLVAAMVLALLVNIVAARHYKRWDFTTGGLYTLSRATTETLHTLGEPIRIDVLVPTSDPLSLSLRHLLLAYGAETNRLDIHFTDPDRHAAEFLAIQRKYDERVIEGRIITEAAIVISRGERAHFVTPRDLVEVDDAEDTRARPRLEQALTVGIRTVVSTDRSQICFTTGHGEKSIEQGASGLASLRDRLRLNGHDVVSVSTKASSNDNPTQSSYSSCRVVIVAGPSDKFSEGDAQKLNAFVEQGGNIFVAVGPVPDDKSEHYEDLGLSGLLGTFGLELNKNFIFETDARLRSSRGFGETFMPITKPHAVTEGLVGSEQTGSGPVFTVASSIKATGKGSAAVTPLLVTSDEAFGMVDFFAWAKNPSEPEATDGDTKGPLAISYAGELPAHGGAARGARMVAVASSSPMMGENWMSDELRGTAVFVESALAWLASSPTPIDIPKKPAMTSSLKLSEDALASIFRYVVIFIPLASVLIGLAIQLRRRSTERRRGAKPRNER
jgi:hypothetical protein